MNTELLKLLPVEKIPIKNDENSIHFENVKIFNKTVDSTGMCFIYNT